MQPDKNTNIAVQQLKALRDLTELIVDISDNIDESSNASYDFNQKLGSLVVDIRETLKTLSKKEKTEKEPDYKPIVEAVKKLEGKLDFKPQVNVEAPIVKVNTDVDKLIKSLETNVAKYFKDAIKLIPKTEIPKTDLSKAESLLSDVLEQLGSIDTGVRMKPQFPNSIQVSNTVPITGEITSDVSVKAADSPSIDAFARWRVSNPETIFDSKQIFDSQPLFWDDQEVSGSGTSSSHSTDTASTTIGVSLNTAGRRVRQTFRRLNYQPGKSQLVLLTGTLGSTGGGTGITRSAGIYDDNNGIFFKDDEGVLKAVIRSNATGTPVDTAVAQSSWNLDKLDGTGSSGITLDHTKSQIIIIDYEWLGVGRVRVGFVFDGIPVYCHQFLQANNNAGVYMSTPNLPLRYEIENDGTGVASTLEHICTSVVSEGGLQDNGLVRYSSTANTQVDCAVVGTFYGVKGIRLKSTALGGTVKLLNTALQVQSASDDLEYVLIFNPTVAGTPTWNDEANSTVQTATGATANTVTGGTYITGGYIASGNAQNASGIIAQEIPNSLLLGAGIDGTPDEIWLCAKPLTNINTLVEGSITWRELS